MSLKTRRYITVFSFLSLAVLLLAGVAGLSQLRHWRVDLTEDKLYTLSEGSRHIVSSMQEPVTLTFYYSEGLAQDIPALANYARRVQEILNEYVRISDGKITLDVVNPEVFSEQEDEAAAAGLTGFPNGQGEVIYLGLVGDRAGQHEAIGFFNPQRENLMEYDISQLVFRLARTKPVTAAVLSGLPVFRSMDYKTNQARQPWVVMDQLQKMFDVRQLIDQNIDAIEPDVDLLVVIHPRLLPPRTLYAIDQYVLRGGKIMVFVDPVAEMDESEAMMGTGFTDRSSTLDKLFDAWGVRFDPSKVLLDMGYAHSIPVTQYGREVPHLGVLGLQELAINREQNVIADLDNINLASVGAFSHRSEVGTTFIPLLSSSSQAQLMDAEAYALMGNHEELLRKFQSENRQYAIAALISGNVKTAFPEGRPEMLAVDAANRDAVAIDTVGAPGPAIPVSSVAQVRESIQPLQAIVVADTDILTDRMWAQVIDFYGQKEINAFAANGDMVTNMVEALTGSVDLISLRSRGTYQRPFTVVDELERTAGNRLREEQDALMDSLAATEQKIAELSKSSGASEAVQSDSMALTQEQQATITAFQKEKQTIRKNLREVQRQLNHDVDQLGLFLKIINIAAVPVLLSIIAVLLSLFRSRRVRRM